MPLLFPADPHALLVLAPQLVDSSALLEALAPLGTGDMFCATAPDDGLDESAEFAELSGYEDDELFGYYSATFSDTVATFVVEVERATADTATRYEVHVAEAGPGADRLRYRVAKAVVAATGGYAADAQGSPIKLAPPADPFGALW